MSLITVATSIAASPSSSPAATTAPVESTVPPIQAPPTVSFIPAILMRTGRPTRSITVDNNEIEMTRVRRSFLALVAAATAIAAETPQTEVAAAIMTVSFLSNFRTDVPYLYIINRTRGVTPQASSRPCIPKFSIFENRISEPSRTSPIFI